MNKLQQAWHFWSNGWHKAKREAQAMRPVLFSSDADYMHGVRQLAQFGMPDVKARAKCILKKVENGK